MSYDVALFAFKEVIIRPELGLFTFFTIFNKVLIIFLIFANYFVSIMQITVFL
jgi:hypothetical protein